MCTKDEEREPLQPDGNNKDVKVITTIFFCKSESEIVSLKSESEMVFKKKWSSGDKRTDRRFDKAGPGW